MASDGPCSLTSVFFIALVVTLPCSVVFTEDGTVHGHAGDDGESHVDVRFPPVVDKVGDGAHPTGHMKPFGHHREPDAKVTEYDRFIHPKEFWEKHVTKLEPLVLKGGALGSSANQKWTDAYLDDKYHDVHVIIERKVERRPQIKLRMTLRHFLQHYEEKNWYIVSLLPNEMRHEVEAPACLFCGNFQHNIQELNFWMSSGGTASIIHYDADHNIHCLLAGRKDFMMIDPYYNRYLDLYKPADAGSGFTSINVDSIDMVTFPELSKVQWIWTTLLPGDCIYIPSKYVHQVRSYGRSISVTTLFTTHGVFNQTDCHNFTYNYSSLADVDVMWTYEQGDKTIDIGYGDVRVIKDFLLEELEDGKLAKDIFAEAYQTITAGLDDDDEVQSIDKVWSFLDEQGKGFVTKEEILAFDREKLKKFSRMTTPPAGPLGEYIVSEDKMEELLKMEEEQDSQIRAFEGNEMLNQGATRDALQSRGQHEEL